MPMLMETEDPNGARQYGGGVSYSVAVYNLSITVVGAGIMTLPAVVRDLGLIPGLLAIVAAAALVLRSVDFVLRHCRSPSYPSYADAVGDVLGEVRRRLLLFCVVVNNLGTIIVYMYTIGNVLSGVTSLEGDIHHRGVLEKWFGMQDWWNERQIVLFLTSVLVFAPLIYFKRVDSLKYTSALAIILAVVFVVITSGIAALKAVKGSVRKPRLFPSIVDHKSFWKLFTTVPVLVTAYICHCSLHPTKNELRDPSQMKSIVQTFLRICCVVYIAASLSGFLLFGEETLDVVLGNFHTDFGFVTHGSLLNDVLRVGYAMHLTLVFSIIFYSLRLDLMDLLFPRATHDSQRLFVITFVLTVLVLLGADFFSSFSFALLITCAIASVATGFIFPAAIALRDVHGIASRNDKALSWLMIVLAFSSCVATITFAVVKFISAG